jgi:hypothetical protein
MLRLSFHEARGGGIAAAALGVFLAATKVAASVECILITTMKNTTAKVVA